MHPLAEMTDTMVERICVQLDSHCRVVALVPPAPPPLREREDTVAAH
jgi:hypothetical protein